ncbi:MAG TPA: magnesium transporter CorA family protein [Thermotogota bacterium]|jgi:magnesium transporter|nr:magnesium transporter CorA family protein [Thermotogota bacterium]NLH19578.1 magnesium transporter CorA family protein [Thermotogaceae bacterium]OQC30756.1 MAG: Magnesium transport protein CorA [Thermotogota bacterium ADurb.Bin062]HNW47655.1 magnesium transporter CorA family protein [Thermotogota bacterium]HNY82665.1 magnesium transporter CorA family protein [Thermotogota bacterium]
MVRFFSRENEKVVEKNGFSQDCIILVVNPTREEAAMISSLLDFTPDFIHDVQDLDERARIDYGEKVIQIILKVPYKDASDEKLLYKTIPLNILLGENYILLGSKYPVEFVQKMIDESKVNPKKRSRMIFQLMYKNAILFLNHLKEINKITDSIEEKLQEAMKNKELQQLMYLEKSLVYFTTSLRSNEIVMERILRGNVFEIFDEDRELLEDTIVENKQALEMANIYSSILSGMMDAYASVISNNVNSIMKVLTIVTIVLQIPAILSSFYGMNIPLPFQQEGLVFIFILAWSVVIGMLILLWFKKKKWI